MTVPAHVTRQNIEDFLYFEAALLDEWRLEEWFNLLTEDAIYEIPPTDDSRYTGDAQTTLYLIADNIVRIRGRIDRLRSGKAFVEDPHSRTRRNISNVRILEDSGSSLLIQANFIVYRTRYEVLDVFVGQLEYGLVVAGNSFRIRTRRVVLDQEALRPQGCISFLL